MIDWTRRLTGCLVHWLVEQVFYDPKECSYETLCKVVLGRIGALTAARCHLTWHVSLTSLIDHPHLRQSQAPQIETGVGQVKLAEALYPDLCDCVWLWCVQTRR